MDFTKTHVAKDLKVDRPLLSCCYTPDGQYVFAGSEDFQVWRFPTGEGESVAFNTEAWVRSLAVVDEGKTLITGGYDGRMMWWDALSGQPTATRTVDAHAGWIRSIAISPDGKTLASVGNDLIVKLWNVADGTTIRELKGHEHYIYNVAFHPTQLLLVTGDLYGNLFEWDLNSGEKKREWKSESLSKYDTGFRAQIGGFRGLKFSHDGKQLACCGITNVSNAFAGVGNPSVVIFDYDKGEQTIEHLSKGPLQGVAWNVVLHPENVIISCTGGSGGNLLFWKPGEKETFHQLKMPSDVRDLCLSPDGKYVAAAHGNGHLSLCLLDAKPA